MTLSSPRLELGISRVSGGRINQLSHESAYPFQIVTVDVVPDMSGKSISGDARFPHLPPSKAVVLKHWTLVSDDLITPGSNSGQYKDTFKCNIVDGDGKVCGADRSILHYRGKAVSTTNLIRHVADMAHKCASHSAVDAVLKNASPNYVTVGGESQHMHTFAESFTHHVDLLWAHGGGLSWNMIHTNEDFQQYVRGFEPRARFPSHRVRHRLPQVVLDL